MATVTYRYGNIQRVKLKAAATAISADTPVVLSNNLLVEASQGGPITGIALQNIAASGIGVVALDGVYSFAAAAGFNGAIGQFVCTAAENGKVDAGSQSNTYIGRIVDFDPAGSATDVRVSIISDFDGKTMKTVP